MKDKESNLHEMIERADEMVPKKKGGPLDAEHIWDKKPGKIMGEDGPVMSNKYLKRFKEIITK